MLNQTAIYALRAMGFLAAHNTGKPVHSALIAKEMNIPHNFLSKILNRLSQTGLIHAVRGRGGGVRLSRPSSEILLYDVVSLFMKINDYNKCLLGMHACDGTCGLHVRWQIVSEQFEKLLNDTTIDQIV
jgi:Rrf2 family protein